MNDIRLGCLLSYAGEGSDIFVDSGVNNQQLVSCFLHRLMIAGVQQYSAISLPFGVQNNVLAVFLDPHLHLDLGE